MVSSIPQSTTIIECTFTGPTPTTHTPPSSTVTTSLTQKPSTTTTTAFTTASPTPTTSVTGKATVIIIS